MSALSLKTETPRVIPTQPLFSVNSLSKQPATEERPALHNPLGGTPAHPRKLKQQRHRAGALRAGNSKGGLIPKENESPATLLPAQRAVRCCPKSSCQPKAELRAQPVSPALAGEFPTKFCPKYNLEIQVRRSCAIAQHGRGFSSPSSFVHDSFCSS